MKIIFKGDVFGPTGISTANRELVKALVKNGCEVQVSDMWNDKYEFNKGLEYLNSPVNATSKGIITLFAGYPNHWISGHGRIIGHPIHEGTRIWPEWAQIINKCEKIFVCSESNKNLYRWNDVTIPIEVINYGTNPEVYKPQDGVQVVPKGIPVDLTKESYYFLSVNSWTGEEGDRKGTDLLIKAFDEEFKPGEATLVLKIGTFWQAKRDYVECVRKILGHDNPNIIIQSDYIPEKDLVKLYQTCDCFVAPTKGEGFGMTLINALACGLPLIVTRDVNSGHMDFCKDRESVLWIESFEIEQGDERFYIKGNMLAKPDFESIKKQMRYAFEHKDELKEKALKDSEFIRKNFTWSITAKKIMEFLK